MAKTTIHSDYIPDNAITSTKIAENSIGAREIATNAITTLYVADGSVTTVKIADDAITSAKLDTNIDIAGTLGVTGNITGTLATAAQTNITSVGTLTGLNVAGTPTFDGLTVEGDTLSMSHTGNTSTISLTQKVGTQNSIATILANREDTSTSASRLVFSTNDGTSTLQRMRINNGGDISFYEDTGTTAKLFWDASAERLGIGTTSPSETLHVSSRSRIQNLYLGEVASNFDVVQATSSAGLYLTGGGSNGIYLDSSANVGINTSNPLSKLDVAGNVRISDGVLEFDKPSVYGFRFLQNDAGNDLSIQQGDANNANYVTRLNIGSTGKVGIGETNPTNAKLEILQAGDHDAHSTHGIAIHSTGNTNFTSMYMGCEDAIDSAYIQAVALDGSFTSKSLLLNANGGNVGIGISNPSEKLHIRDSSTNADVYIKIANDSRDWFMGVEGSNSDILSFKTHDASNLLNITSSGNVGIGGTPDSSGRLLVTNGGTNQIVLKGTSGTTNLNMGNFSGGGYISQNYYYSGGHQADDNTKGAFEIFIGDDIYGINYHSAGAMGTRRRDFSITSAGNVGMGTNNPGFASGSGLEIERAGIATLRFQNTSSGKSVEITQDSDFKIESMNSASDILLMPTANVGIGTSSPTEKLHVYSGTGNVPAKFESGDAYSIITFADSGTSGTVGTGAQSNDLIFYSGDALRMRLSSGGVVSADGVYNTTTSDAANVRVLSNGNIVRSTSSERYKNTITDASKGLTELNNLRPVTYKGNNDGDTVFYGLIAEEVHEAGLTEFVEYNDANEPDALRYPHMVSLCIKAIQEQQTIIDDLKSRLDEAGL